MCMCIDTFFVFIFCTATDCYVLQLEMRVRLICAIKFYLLTYLLITQWYRAIRSSTGKMAVDTEAVATVCSRAFPAGWLVLFNHQYKQHGPHTAGWCKHSDTSHGDVASKDDIHHAACCQQNDWHIISSPNCNCPMEMNNSDRIQTNNETV